MLYGAVRHLRPEVVVELGTAGGYSTAWMLLALEELEHGHIWTCDLVPSDNPAWQQIGLNTTRLTYFSNDTVESIQNKLPNEFDLVFHDAGHGLEEVRKDLAWILPRLREGGCLVIHDVVYSKEMGDWVLKTFDTDTEHFKYEQIEEGCGVAIITCIKKLENDKSCKDELSGSMTQKAMASLPEKMVKIISPTFQKSKISKGAKRSRKTKTLYSSRASSQKALAQKPSLPKQHPAELRGATFG